MNDITHDHTGADPGPRGQSRPRRAGILAVAALAVAMLAAACSSGGSTTPAPTSAASTTAAPTAAAPATSAPATSAPATSAPTAYQMALAYAQCMRSHGEPTWPAPTSDGNFTGDIDTASALYLSANSACHHLLPNGGILTQAQAQAALDALTKYADCMRSHGIPQYPGPDPRTVQAGDTSPWNITERTLHITAQQFNTASQACLKLQPTISRTS